MTRTTVIHVRIDADLKDKAQKLFKQMGMSMTEAITIFLTQVVNEERLPFEVKISKTKRTK